MTSGELALFVTIWLAVIGFVAGQAGQRIAVETGRAPAWAWPVWCVGAFAGVLHAVLAFDIRYDWSQEQAIRATAEQTAAVYGLHWGGGLYVNYAFLAAWLADAAWWRLAPARFRARPTLVTTTFRVFSLIVLVNATVVFAAASRRIIGLTLIALLMWIWRPVSR